MVKAAFDNIRYVPPFLIKIPSPHLRVKMGTYYIFAPSNLYTAPLVSGNIFMFIIKQKGEKHKRIEISICRIFCKKRLFRSWELSKAVIAQRLQFCVFNLSTIIEITKAAHSSVMDCLMVLFFRLCFTAIICYGFSAIIWFVPAIGRNSM